MSDELGQGSADVGHVWVAVGQCMAHDSILPAIPGPAVVVQI